MPSLRFEIDGTNAMGTSERVSSTCPTAPTSVSMSIGFYCAGQRATASEVRFDDVTFDAR